MDIAERALAFHDLHSQPAPLRLPNAWDAGSARLVEHLGAQAIATTSAGVAWSLGYRDGDVLPVGQHLAAIERIARMLTVPLSVDIEGGYADDPHQVGEHVARFIAAGAAGINIQDGAGSPERLCEKIEQARKAAQRLGVKLYINVRTDVYARGLVEPQARVAETLDRARRYASAGADGLFVLGVVDREEIHAIAAGTRLRLNVIAWPGLPPVAELGALGVRRVSAGSWLPQQLWARTTELASGFLADGRSQPLIEGAAPYAQVNGFF
ncbi:isocitrate lyase/phosphoenolpyruvate mutase family protein [Massilia solisilvae]|uniref:Isocitrate lyase/phosphoenolpyruvate mutase family protein n=1 Tax=Massilia solisilvae TaxID=1811225 RepID=A0ABT2BP61_9BURK|nr:isocitrate lyase/phosphoenolpyruvate mutase family protein [Massilia solisilvae]MCS0610301.1 isocitrate lyase/phosphoenolpyruvate mutase family protein [Massilia solisilvae]